MSIWHSIPWSYELCISTGLPSCLRFPLRLFILGRHEYEFNLPSGPFTIWSVKGTAWTSSHQTRLLRPWLLQWSQLKWSCCVGSYDASGSTFLVVTGDAYFRPLNLSCSLILESMLGHKRVEDGVGRKRAWIIIDPSVKHTIFSTSPLWDNNKLSLLLVIFNDTKIGKFRVANIYAMREVECGTWCLYVYIFVFSFSFSY